MAMHPAVAERLARLAPDQRAAATAPPGPVLCVAPAGSGKTTTLVARVAWLVDGGCLPAAITVVAFNTRAAVELGERLSVALEPLGVAPRAVRVRTFHALGREMLREAGRSVELADRATVLRSLVPELSRADLGRLDLAISRLKLDLRVAAADIAADPLAGPVARTFVAYEAALQDADMLDFDDLVVRALELLDADPGVLASWRGRCQELLVDEAQDLDRTQLDLALRLAAPANRVFLVGDDDQTIYGWRLADVRRVLGLAASLPGLRRVDLTVNYRCPGPVVARAVRLIEVNRERFAKTIRPRPEAPGRLILAPSAADDAIRLRRAMAAWPADDATSAVLTRTNRELLPAVVACLDLDRPFRAPALPLPLLDDRLDALLVLVDATPPDRPLLVRIGMVRHRLAVEPGALVAPSTPGTAVDGAKDDAVDDDRPTPADLAAAVLGWAVTSTTIEDLTARIAHARERLHALHRDDAPLTLATAHGTKGLEFDHVVVLADGFPARRAVSEAAEPERVLEEERRLAYVAWTRARRTLTLLYDPDAVPVFLREAFDPAELEPAA
jgi:superfamily I DNA/RNA helicase